MTFLHRDFIQVSEGLVFAVVMSGAEEGRVLCFLRYMRSDGRWRKLSTEQANEILRSRYPDYLHYSSQRDAKLHAVPIGSIVHHYRPRVRLDEILNGRSSNMLEDKLRRLMNEFSRHGIASGEMGVTGSMLLGAQTRESDIDLVAYGRDVFHGARAIVKELLEQGVLDELDTEAWREAYRRRGCSLTLAEFVWHEQRKYNKGLFEGTKFDLGMVEEGDVGSTTPHFKKKGKALIEAQVIDDANAFDYPARYKVNDSYIVEVVSFTATYVGQARVGETIEVAGWLEESEHGLRRIVVGSDREAQDEYIKVVHPEKSS